MTSALQEKRRDKRVGLGWPVFLDNAVGITRDVSASGVFFWAMGTYPVGHSISFWMGRTPTSEKFMLKCRGVVSRTEPRGNYVGVAVRISDRSDGGASYT